MAVVASSATANVTNTHAADDFWLKDPADPGRNMTLAVIPPFVVDEPEPQETLEVIGRRLALVVSGLIQSARGTVALEFYRDELEAFRTLRRSQRVLLLSAPWGDQWYVRLGPVAPAQVSFPGLESVWTTQVAWTEVGRP